MAGNGFYSGHSPGAVIAATFLLLPLLSPAGEDHDAARQLVESGRILSLETILVSVRERVEGRVIEVELERSKERYVYEIELLDSGGRVRELEVDAMTGEIVRDRQER